MRLSARDNCTMHVPARSTRQSLLGEQSANSRRAPHQGRERMAAIFGAFEFYTPHADQRGAARSHGVKLCKPRGTGACVRIGHTVCIDIADICVTLKCKKTFYITAVNNSQKKNRYINVDRTFGHYLGLENTRNLIITLAAEAARVIIIFLVFSKPR